MVFRLFQKQLPWTGSPTRPSTAEPTVNGSIRPERAAGRTAARTSPPRTAMSPDPKSKQRKTNQPLRRNKGALLSFERTRGFPDSRKVIVFQNKFDNFLLFLVCFECLNILISAGVFNLQRLNFVRKNFQIDSRHSMLIIC